MGGNDLRSLAIDFWRSRPPSSPRWGSRSLFVPNYKNLMEKCRARKKENEQKWKESLEKDRLGNKKNQAKKKKIICKNEEIALKHRREKVRLRVQVWRKKKTLQRLNDSSYETPLGTYSCNNILHKAISKGSKALPFSPNKKKAVLNLLVKQSFGKELFTVKKPPQTRRLPVDIGTVRKFYNSDEVNWQTPGKHQQVKQFKWILPKITILFIKMRCKVHIGNIHSKFTAYNLRHSADDLHVEWNTFAPGHGKGAVDAIVTTSEDFYNCARELSPTVTVLYVPKSDVDSTSSFLNERWKDVKEIPGIRKFHHFQKAHGNFVFCGITVVSHSEKVQVTKSMYTDSEEEASTLPSINPEPSTETSSTTELLPCNINPGTYVFVSFAIGNKFDSLYKYVGICQTHVEDNDEVRVVFLKLHGKTGRLFMIDEHDEKYIQYDQIIKILSPPEIVTWEPEFQRPDETLPEFVESVRTLIRALDLTLPKAEIIDDACCE
ncbi:hypothetical protein PR048_031725 [Dryococelus australis]|uniref:Uncharacterized protein n=1 Tax=Dryococelus australis TaxID=614101 RepID=A0ABQ9GA52_9NEOP|nr:hypothetical protein PR048_031725 [Dryococelus australis]